MELKKGTECGGPIAVDVRDVPGLRGIAMLRRA